ncbi:MAG: hypothetical protein JNK82_17040 [Myxococcaceae bacterium]|nr:hypothetical protein [Myxococcaceae bacterium]
MSALALVISWALSAGTVHYKQTPIEQLLVAGWGSAPEASLRKFPKLTREDAATFCMREKGATTCLLYTSGRLARVEYRYTAEINILKSLHDQFGAANRVETKPLLSMYCWRREQYDMTAVQQPDKSEREDVYGGRTVVLEYRPPFECGAIDAGTP